MIKYLFLVAFLCIFSFGCTKSAGTPPKPLGQCGDTLSPAINNTPPLPSCSQQPNAVSATQIFPGAVIYVTPRNNEIIPNGDFKYQYNIDFLTDGAPSAGSLSVKVPNLSGGGSTILGSLTAQAQCSYTSGNYYTVSFSYVGNSSHPEALVDSSAGLLPVQVCLEAECVSAASYVDVSDTKQSVGFEAISRQGFGYGLYVSLLMPDYELQPVNASTFFSSKDPGIYSDLSPLWNWSEVDWEFVPMSSTLAGRNEVFYCTHPGDLACSLYWTNMKTTQTTVPMLEPTGVGYTLDNIISNPNSSPLFSTAFTDSSGKAYAQNSKIPNYDILEQYVLSNQSQFQTFDNTPHGVSINLALMEGIQDGSGQYIFKGTGNWGKVSDANLAQDYPDTYDLRTRYVTFNIIHMPYGNPVSAFPGISPRTDIDDNKIPWTGSGLAEGYVGHGLLGVPVYQELRPNGSRRSAVGTNYSSPTGVFVPQNSVTPYKKFYYYAVNYTATSMDFYMVDPCDSKLNGGDLNMSNIALFKPVRSFQIRDNPTDQVTTKDANGNLIDHKYYGLMKFGLDEPNPPIDSTNGEGCNFQVYSYGAQNGFCALKWQLQTWLISGLAGSEYAKSNLYVSNYLKKIAVYPAVGQPQSKQEIDFTQLTSQNWRYEFQKNFAITFGNGPYLGDGIQYLNKGFWNLDLKQNPTDGQNALTFTQMPYFYYAQITKQQESAGSFVYQFTPALGKYLVKMDAAPYAYVAASSWDTAESEVFSVPAGQSATVNVYQMSSTASSIEAGSSPVQTCGVTFQANGVPAYTNISNCDSQNFTISRLQTMVADNINAPKSVNPATVACSGASCTFTVNWTNHSIAHQHPLAQYFIVPNQNLVPVNSDYYQALVNGGALVSASSTSAAFTLPVSMVSTSNPDVTVYACISGGAYPYTCPSSANGYAVDLNMSQVSTGGSDLRPVAITGASANNSVVSATWLLPTGTPTEDPAAQCFISVSGTTPTCTQIASSLTRCSNKFDNITLSASPPADAKVSIVSCYGTNCPTNTRCGSNSLTASSVGIAFNSVPLTVPDSVNPATVSNCSSGTCQYAVSWTNPAQQLTGAKYFIVPSTVLPTCVPGGSYTGEYVDLLNSSGTLVASTVNSTTFTLPQKYVDSNHPDVTVYVCGTAENPCPSLPFAANLCGPNQNTPVSGLSAASSNTGSNLMPISAASSQTSGDTLTISWTNPANQASGGYCYANITGVPITQAVYSQAGFVVACSGGSLNLSQTAICNTVEVTCNSNQLPPLVCPPGGCGTGKPSVQLPETLSIFSCFKDLSLGINTCPDETSNYSNGAFIVSGTANIGSASVSY